MYKGWCALLLAALLTGCIAERPAAADDPERFEERIDQAPDAQARDARTVDADIRDATPVDLSDAVDMSPDVAVDAAPPPPRCEAVFGEGVWHPYTVEPERSGPFVYWQDGALRWLAADGDARSLPAPERHPSPAGGVLFSGVREHRPRTVVVHDLFSGETIRSSGFLYAANASDGYVSWAGREGVYLRRPGGPTVRLHDCIRNCPFLLHTDEAIWLLGRARSQVEPALLRYPLRGGEPDIFSGPIRDPRATHGRRSVHWWTINDPPNGDQARQVIAAGTARVPWHTAPNRPTPAWIEGTDRAAFSAPDAMVIANAEGEIARVPRVFGPLMTAAGLIVARAAGEVILVDADGRERGRIPGFDYSLFHRRQRTVIRVEREADALLVEVTDEGFEVVAAVEFGARFAWSPDDVHLIVSEARGHTLYDLATRRTHPLVMPPNGRPVWITSTRFAWVEPDGRLLTESIEGDRMDHGGRFLSVLPLGLSDQNCPMVVVSRPAAEQNAVGELSRQALP